MVDLCRLCASLRKIDALVSIRDDTNEICQKLRECCQLSIQMQDALPKSLCLDCLENLNNSHKFYTKVQEAQETLQTLFPSTSEGEDKNNDKTSETLAQTLAAASGLNNKRKVSLNENEIASSNIEGEKNKKKKISLKELEVTSKKTKAATKNNLKDDDSAEQNRISNNDEFSVSLQTAVKEKYLQKVCEMLDVSEEEMTEDDCFEILDTIYEKGIERNGDINNEIQMEESVEEPQLEEHHVLQETIIDDYIIKVLDKELDVALENKEDVVPEQEKEFDMEIQYLRLENEEVEDLQSDAEVHIIDKVEPNEPTPTSSLIEFKSWKSYTYLCTDCEFKGASFIDLRKHAEDEHDINHIDKLHYKCYDCQKYIPRYNFFLNHIRSKHHPLLKLQCDSCDLNCESYEQLSFHRNVNCLETNEFANILPCTQCFKSFHNTYGLQNHIKLQHTTPENKVKYKCSQCDKEFQQKSCLKVHELTHTDNKKYSCDVCKRTFANKSSLELHLYSHIEEKTFKCNICNKSYKTFITLDQHQVIHSDVKPFKCDYCDKTFRKKIEKISHERTHTGEMPYKCQHCEKHFRFLSALIAHTRSHDGVKPFACEYCEQTFADSSNRNKHVKRKHQNGEKDENT